MKAHSGPRADDVQSIDAIIAAIYDVISGPAGERDWERDRHLFLPQARLIRTGKRPDGSVRYQVMTVDEFAADAAPILEKGFYETEIARTTEIFGNIAHAFSTYESRHRPQEAPFSAPVPTAWDRPHVARFSESPPLEPHWPSAVEVWEATIVPQ